jgi:hypothetical protein
MTRPETHKPATAADARYPALTICHKIGGAFVTAGDGPFADQAPIVASFANPADAQAFVAAYYAAPPPAAPAPPVPGVLVLQSSEQFAALLADMSARLVQGRDEGDLNEVCEWLTEALRWLVTLKAPCVVTYPNANVARVCNTDLETLDVLPIEAGHGEAMTEDELSGPRLVGWADFEAGAPVFEPRPGCDVFEWQAGWWTAYARRYGEGYLAGAVYGQTSADNDHENPHDQFSGAWEAWGAGFEDRSRAEARKIAPSTRR